MTLGQRIRNRRLELGLSQTELAERLGYKSKVSISNAENDRDDMTTTRIEKYAKALETTPSYLMGWEDETDYLIGENIIVEHEIKHNNRLDELSKLLNRLSEKDVNMIIQYAEFLSKRKEE